MDLSKREGSVIDIQNGIIEFDFGIDDPEMTFELDLRCLPATNSDA